MSNQRYFYFDQTLCFGCEACVIACKDWNDVKPGTASYRRKVTTETGDYPNVKVYNALVSCYHCEEPICVEVCPMMAITKMEDTGAVIVDREKCISCKSCKGMCPYSAPQFDDSIIDPKMQKCTMCWDRLNDDTWNVHQKVPVCVASCVQRAIKFGTKEELRAEGIDIDNEELSIVGYNHDAKLNPSVRFKRKI